MNSEEHRPRLKMEMYQNRGLKLLRPLALFMIEGRRHSAFRGSMDRSGGNTAVSKLQWLISAAVNRARRTPVECETR